MKITYTAPDISCEGCTNAIEKSISKMPGVASVTADPGTKKIEVEFDEKRVDDQAIRNRLILAGYPPSAD